MILSAHQPAYLPWLGYFDKIVRSNVFVFLDSVQFEKNSFINRNKIKTPQGSIWLSIPVKIKGHISSTLLETKIDNDQDWKNKHLKTIYYNYKKALRFDKCYPKLEVLYQEKFDLLSDFCFYHLRFWLKELNIQKKIVRSSELQVEGNKSELILNLCKSFSANHYISGEQGKDYLKEEEFKKLGISVEYQDYNHPVYPQLHGEFLPYMSILDLWMNTDQFWLITGGTNELLSRMGSKI